MITTLITGERANQEKAQLKIKAHAVTMSDSLSDLSPCSPTLDAPDTKTEQSPRRKTEQSPRRKTKRKECSDPNVQPRKRKHSYLTQKEEMERLAMDVSALTVQLAYLKGQVEDRLTPAQQNEAMKELLRTQQQSLWRAHSLLSNRLKAQRINPLATYIHLSRDLYERRETLLALHHQKVTVGRQFVIERSLGLDLLVPYRSEDLYLNAQGDYCCDRFDINQFYGAQGIQEVYEALMFYSGNIEITVTEKLGHITLREDYDSVENRISHQRLVSCDDNGVLHEMNGVTFMEFVDRGQDGDSYGVFANDFVDVDDLHPYRPALNVRKDVVGTVVITAHKRKKPKQKQTRPCLLLGESQKEDDEELVVVMRRAVFVKLHHTELELSESMLQGVRESVTRWNDVIAKSMQDRLASNHGNRPAA